MRRGDAEPIVSGECDRIAAADGPAAKHQGIHIDADRVVLCRSPEDPRIVGQIMPGCPEVTVSSRRPAGGDNRNRVVKATRYHSYGAPSLFGAQGEQVGSALQRPPLAVPVTSCRRYRLYLWLDLGVGGDLSRERLAHVLRLSRPHERQCNGE